MQALPTEPIFETIREVPTTKYAPVRTVYDALETSELLHAVENVLTDGGRRLALGEIFVRSLRTPEVQQLQRQGNSAEDWSRVRAAEDFDASRVWNSHFLGHVLLGSFVRKVAVDGLEVPAGVYGSRVANCVIGHDALVQDVKLLNRYVVGVDAVLFDCGSITCDTRTAFGNGAVLSLGLECGGRDVPVFAEIDVSTAAAVACQRTPRDFQAEFAHAVAEYTARASCPIGIIEHGAVVCHTPRVKNSYVGPCARIDSATLVADSTLLSSVNEPTQITSGAHVVGSLLQWGSVAETMALVDHCVLTEHSHAERHAKLTRSLIGPNTGIAEGEVTCSLVGPFVNFHHQALLIAALWPEGKGNVSHGANVGSNHTGKAPDQELRPGEGTFFGLGVNIRFPADFSKAPYTLFAGGVSTMPQKLAFPFSLVNTPTAMYPGISPAYNEIFPAWLLSDNYFTIKRNEEKYKTRNRARRGLFQYEILRPEIVELMRDALHRLENVREIREVYTDKDIDGLGKNFLVESQRKKALATYRFFIEYYALLGLKDRVRKELNAAPSPAIFRLLDRPSEDPRWEHQRQILVNELNILDIADGLRELPRIVEAIARGVEHSKAKDDERGKRIIDDYATVHVAAHEDPFVRQTWEETRVLKHEVAELLERLGA